MLIISTARGVKKIKDLKQGELFMYADTIAIKTPYIDERGGCECIVIGTGEIFRSGANSPDELNNFLVTPLLITKEHD